jgi:hypothetical protein
LRASRYSRSPHFFACLQLEFVKFKDHLGKLESVTPLLRSTMLTVIGTWKEPQSPRNRLKNFLVDMPKIVLKET